ncbi:MAG TPA: S8 family serine peptidase [Gemmataceae bacterium]|nr:S8 family serine peptidase [Gemmataceae bacterium]
MRTPVFLSVVAIAVCSLATPADEPRPLSAARLANATEVRQQLGLLPEYRELPGLNRLKVAVLDYGFDGIESGRPYLPKNTVVVEHYDAGLVRRFGLGDPAYHKAFAPGNPHGRLMAQIIWAMTGFDPRGPQLYLLNANGPTMFRRAVRYAIEAHVNVILFSNVFEGGGNGDGWGPINQIVEPALNAGIIWINAAGNYGGCVYEGPVRVGTDDYLQFRADADPTALRFRNRLDENTVTVTLTWNDYREKEDAGTSKDLDLYVEDWAGHRLGASELKQVPGSEPAHAGESHNPRERVVLTNLAAEPQRDYRIRIRARSQNFTAKDRIRVLVTAARESYPNPQTGDAAAALRFVDASDKDEIYPPADNPRVLTVGDVSPASAVGPTADYRLKPEVVIEDSRAFFSDGSVTSGSSNAAAYFAGVVTVLKAAEPGLRTRHLLSLAYGSSATTATTTARTRAPVSTSTSSYGASTQMFLPMPRKTGAVYPEGFGNALARYRAAIPSTGRIPYPALRSSAAQSPRPTLGSSRELLPAPRPMLSSATARAALRGKVWRTPTRQELAQIVRLR